MASRMRVTSLMNEARCYQALPITAKTIGHRTQDGTLDCRNEVSSSPDQNCALTRDKQGLARIAQCRVSCAFNIQVRCTMSLLWQQVGAIEALPGIGADWVRQ